MRQATSWTRPLQYAVAGWYVLQGVYALSLPLWMSGPMAQVMSRSVQRQQQLSPTAKPPPADLINVMTSMMTVALWVAAVIGLAISVVAIVGALRRWTWSYYAVLVLLGLSAISLPVDIINALGGSTVAVASGFSMPSWTYWLGLAGAIPATALFVWMLVALVKRGPWGMTRVASGVS